MYIHTYVCIYDIYIYIGIYIYIYIYCIYVYTYYACTRHGPWRTVYPVRSTGRCLVKRGQSESQCVTFDIRRTRPVHEVTSMGYSPV